MPNAASLTDKLNVPVRPDSLEMPVKVVNRFRRTVVPRIPVERTRCAARMPTGTSVPANPVVWVTPARAVFAVVHKRTNVRISLVAKMPSAELQHMTNRSATARLFTPVEIRIQNVPTNEQSPTAEQRVASKVNASVMARSLSAVMTSPVRTICNVPMKRLVLEENVQTLARYAVPVGTMPFAKLCSIGLAARVPAAT